MQLSKQDIAAGMTILITVAESIRELGEVPNGALYAMLMSKLSIGQYQRVIDTLIGAGLVARDKRHMLRWIGPQLAGSPDRVRH